MAMIIQSAVTLNSSTMCFRMLHRTSRTPSMFRIWRTFFLAKRGPRFLGYVVHFLVVYPLLCQTWKRIGGSSARCPKAPRRLIEKIDAAEHSQQNLSAPILLL